MKILLWALVAVALLIAGFFVLNAYLYDEKQAEEEPQTAYFEEQLTTRGVADIGQPIEGFDANLLILAFPGLVPTDFSGVQTLEGHYEISDGELAFVRREGAMVSSAERMLVAEGYALLLANLSQRLRMPVATEAEVDALIDAIDTSEHLTTRIDEGGSALGVKVIPHEVLEDSRCPANANCVQAGTVRVRATLESGLGTADQEFELNVPITTEAEEVTLVQVTPESIEGETIADAAYEFRFRVTRR